MSLVIGDPFPNLPLQAADGPLDLAERWQAGPLVIAFHRLWCPFCHQAAVEMAAHADVLRNVVLVYPQPATQAAATCAERGLPFICCSDPDRALERAAAVPKIRPTQYLKTFTPTRATAALRAGARPHVPTSDVFQGRGTFVVDADGRVRYVHLAQSVADIAPIEELVAAVRGTFV